MELVVLFSSNLRYIPKHLLLCSRNHVESDKTKTELSNMNGVKEKYRKGMTSNLLIVLFLLSIITESRATQILQGEWKK